MNTFTYIYIYIQIVEGPYERVHDDAGDYEEGDDYWDAPDYGEIGDNEVFIKKCVFLYILACFHSRQWALIFTYIYIYIYIQGIFHRFNNPEEYELIRVVKCSLHSLLNPGIYHINK